MRDIDKQNLRDIVERIIEGYPVEKYETQSAADYVKECDSLLLGKIIKDYGLLHSVSQQRELLLSAICQFTKRNTQKEIQEVEKWIETDFRK